MELKALYQGLPAELLPIDVQILIMKWMNWSYSDLLEAPDELIERIRLHMRAEVAAQPNSSGSSGSTSSPSSNAFGLNTGGRPVRKYRR